MQSDRSAIAQKNHCNSLNGVSMAIRIESTALEVRQHRLMSCAENGISFSNFSRVLSIHSARWFLDEISHRPKRNENRVTRRMNGKAEYVETGQSPWMDDDSEFGSKRSTDRSNRLNGNRSADQWLCKCISHVTHYGMKQNVFTIQFQYRSTTTKSSVTVTKVSHIICRDRSASRSTQQHQLMTGLHTYAHIDRFHQPAEHNAMHTIAWPFAWSNQ